MKTLILIVLIVIGLRDAVHTAQNAEKKECEGKTRPKINQSKYAYVYVESKSVLEKPHFYEEPNVCKDVVAIQYNTKKLNDIKAVNPHRKLMIVDCTGWAEVCEKDFLTASVPFTKTNFSDIGQNKTFAAIVIAKQTLRPGIKFKVLDKELTVRGEKDMYSVYINFAPWRNFANKSVTFPSGAFHHFTPEYVSNFRALSHNSPFTQTYLLQIMHLGSVPASQEITESHRRLASNFVDLDWCSHERRCNGGPFTGPHEQHWGESAHANNDGVARWMNHLFANVYYRSSNKSSLPNDPLHQLPSFRTRFLINEISWYDGVRNRKNKIVSRAQSTGDICYCGHLGCHFESTSETLKHGPNNEIAHEVGHSYGLHDHEGCLDFACKARSFSLNYFENITLPYFMKGGYPKEMKTGSMNAAVPDETDMIFTHISDYSYDKMVHNYANMQNYTLGIDKQIKYDGEEGHFISTVIVTTRIYKDMELIRINAFIPSVAIPDYERGNLMVVAHDHMGNIVNIVQYRMAHERDRIIVLPQDFYPNDGYIHITNKHSKVTKKFFIRDDALELPEVVKGFVLD